MYKVTKFPHGTFSWADNSSTDPEAAKAFYMDLFGWSKVEEPMGEGMFYTMFQHQGESAAALSGMMPDMQKMGVPSHWSNYVTVDDVDAIVDVVTDNGGTIVFGPMDVFDSGRMLQIQDPTGAQLRLWQPRGNIGAGIVNTVGAMCWNELWTKDADAAKSFYGALLGWEFDVGESGYIHIMNNGRSNGAMLQMEESWGEMPSAWQVYFSVADIDESVARVGELGGSIMIPKMEAPGAGHFSMAIDPAGAHFYVIQLIQAEAWED